MRHYVPTSHDRGHARTAPGWDALLIVPATFAAIVAAWAALTTAPSLVLGLVAGVVLRRTVRYGYRAVQHATTTVYRTFDRLVAECRARRLARGE